MCAVVMCVCTCLGRLRVVHVRSPQTDTAYHLRYLPNSVYLNCTAIFLRAFFGVSEIVKLLRILGVFVDTLRRPRQSTGMCCLWTCFTLPVLPYYKEGSILDLLSSSSLCELQWNSFPAVYIPDGPLQGVWILLRCWIHSLDYFYIFNIL